MKLKWIPFFLTSILWISVRFGGGQAYAAQFELMANIPRGGAVSDEHLNDSRCTGKNIMPSLSWKNAPEGTRSFAVTFYDKDAPTGSGFWHWVLYNIPANVASLPGGVKAGPLPEGSVEGNTDRGKTGFFGPCPPVGRKHRYVFTVHALKVDKLPVDKDASPAMVGFVLWQNGLGKATFEVTAGPRTP